MKAVAASQRHGGKVGGGGGPASTVSFSVQTNENACAVHEQ